MSRTSFNVVRSDDSSSNLLPRWIKKLVPAILCCCLLAGCSTIRKAIINKAGDAFAGGGTAFASDDDPEFVRLAAPANLKMIESLLQETPEHQGLLLAAASGFTQYAYAFIQQAGDVLEDEDIDAATHEWGRAKAMFLRARAYALRGIEVSHKGFTETLATDPSNAVSVVEKDEVPFLYWTACAWGGAIALGKDDPELIAGLPQVEALIDRAYALDPDFSDGAIDQFLIGFEWARANANGNPAERSRHHMDRVVELTDGDMAAPFVTFAEVVSVKRQKRNEFNELLNRALTVDADKRPEWRLSNLISQKRARWLLSRVDDLFLDTGVAEPEEGAVP